MLKALLDYNSKENVWLREHKKQIIIGEMIFGIGALGLITMMYAREKQRRAYEVLLQELPTYRVRIRRLD